MHQRYQIDRSAAASEIIDGEAIMMHHESGDYFSADGTGALVWQWIGELKSRDQIVRALHAGFPHASADIAAALDVFLADLLKHGLIRETAAGEDSTPVALPQQAFELGGEFAPPVLHVYSDMREVLLLDPIHDVEDASGWPEPKRPHTKP